MLKNLTLNIEKKSNFQKKILPQEHYCGDEFVQLVGEQKICSKCGEVVDDCNLDNQAPRHEMINKNGSKHNSVSEHCPPLIDKTGKPYLYTSFVRTKNENIKYQRLSIAQNFIIKTTLNQRTKNDKPFELFEDVYNLCLEHFSPYSYNCKDQSELLFKLGYKNFSKTKELIEYAGCCIYTASKNILPFMSRKTIEDISNEMYNEYNKKCIVYLSEYFPQGVDITINEIDYATVSMLAESCNNMADMKEKLSKNKISYHITRKSKINLNPKLYLISQIIESTNKVKNSQIIIKDDFNIDMALNSIIEYQMLLTSENVGNSICMKNLSTEDINKIKNATLSLYNDVISNYFTRSVVPTFLLCFLLKFVTYCMFEKHIYLPFDDILFQTEDMYMKKFEQFFGVVVLSSKRKTKILSSGKELEGKKIINNIIIEKPSNMTKLLMKCLNFNSLGFAHKAQIQPMQNNNLNGVITINDCVLQFQSNNVLLNNKKFKKQLPSNEFINVFNYVAKSNDFTIDDIKNETKVSPFVITLAIKMLITAGCINQQQNKYYKNNNNIYQLLQSKLV